MAVGSILLTVAGVLLLFLVFAFGLASLQYWFSAWDTEGRRRRRQQQQEGAAPASGRRGGSGMATRRASSRGGAVDPELLRSLPVTVYRAAAAAAPGSKEECAVCLAGLEDGEAARFLPRCGHGFHAECVDTWLASHTTCPLCRLTVAKPDALSYPAAMLPLVPPEPAHYAATLPAGVLLGVSAPTGATGVLVIEIPDLAMPTTTAGAPRHGAKVTGLGEAEIVILEAVELREARGGAGSSCSCAGAADGADVEQGVSVSTDQPESNTKFPSSPQ